MTIRDPFTLPCGGTLPNRLAKAAMTEGLADERNGATDRHRRLYERWGSGGAGLLITGNVQIDRRHLERPGNVVIDAETEADELRALRLWAAEGKRHGSRIWMQISHAGRQTPKIVNPQPMAPSAVPLALPTGFGRPRAMTEAEIQAVADGFVRAALVAADAGFEGIQIHAAHGYLLSEFLSPRANRRTDQWGGALENRARLLLDVVRRCRKAVGVGFPLSVKLNSSDFQQGGFDHQECLELVRWLEQAGLDLLEISGGTYEQPRMAGLSGLEPVFDEPVRESTRVREAYFYDYACSVRSVSKIPLMVTGGFRSRAAMDAALAGGALDIVGLARPLCFDPEVPRKLLEGEIEEAPSWEKRLRLGRGILGPASPFALVKALNGWGAQGAFCLQLLRMGDGLDPDPAPSALRGLLGYQRNEARAAKAWAKARTTPGSS